MRVPLAPTPARHCLSTGTANRQPARAPSAYASGYHKRPYPATQTTGSAWEPPTASPTAATARTRTHHHARPAAPAAPPPRQPPQLLQATHRRPQGPPGGVLRGGRGGPRMDHSHGHGQHSPAPQQPTPTPQRGRLDVAAPHVLLALYLHHRDLHLPDPQLLAPQAATPTPEVWADTAPEEIAAYLRITCRRFNTALAGGKERLTHSAHSPTRHPPPARAAEAPGGLGVLSGRPPGRPR